MKICYLADAGSAHTRKWCKFFSDRGHEVHVMSFWPGENEFAELHIMPRLVDPAASSVQKLSYLLQSRALRRGIAKIQPDILHAHYASSYGAACAFARVHPQFLSVWGADIYDFPNASPLHRQVVKAALRRPASLLSTSHALAGEAAKYTSRHFEITPFGVDTALFSPAARTRVAGDGRFVIGTVKKLSPKYGIDDILVAGRQLLRARPEIPLEIRIAGCGPQEDELHQLANDLGLGERTKWLGFIDSKQASVEWANMDVAVIPSRLESESFGVSAVEAGACGVPVIVSDVAGLQESTAPGVSSIVVKRGDLSGIVAALTRLYDNPHDRQRFGAAGRRLSVERFDLAHCFGHVEELYESLLARR